MGTLQAIFYIAAVVLIALAGLRVPARFNLALLGAAIALLAYALPTITAL